jgi:probable type I restriction-modification system
MEDVSIMEKFYVYKDSGVKWLGNIPQHWEVRKIKYVFTERSQKGFPKEPILCSTQKYGVIPQHMYENRVVVVNKGLEGLKLVRKGDFVISLRSFQGGIEYAYYQGIISAAYTILNLNDNCYSNYIKYLMKSFDFIQLLQTCVTGIREGQNINYTLLRKSSLPLPPLAEQRAIVSYLDGKVGQIDTYVAKQTQQIELLKELKQAVIANAVTKGIGTNPNAKRKQSGVNWLGEIPEHWEVSKLRRHFIPRIQKVSDKDFAPLSVTKDGILPQLDTACKTDNGENRKLVRKGDYVVNSRSDRKGSGGISPFDGSVSLINIVIYPIDGEQEYYHYLFRCNNFVEEFYRNGRGIVADLWTTRYQEMKNIEIPIPPLSEQRAIVSYIEAKTASINKLIDAYEQQVERVKEYKQRLISDAVTGKMNVTDEQTQTN